AQAVHDIAVRATSQGGYAKVAWRGEDDVAAGIRPGALTHLSEGQLADEVKSAIEAAVAQRQEAVFDAYIRVYWPEGTRP
ncbi:MAG: hypothetical protein ACRDXX_12390, partial [Stackebrandtia sp.]